MASLPLIFWHTSSGDFATASNWNGGVVPGPADEAVLANGTKNIVTSSADETVAGLEVSSTLELLAGTFSITSFTDNANNITVDDGASLDIAGTFYNPGTIDLDAVSTGADLVFSGGVILQEKGKIVLSDTSSANTISGTGTLENDRNTISGSGTIGDGLSMITNDNKSTIDASYDKKTTLFGLTINSDLTNGGAIESQNPFGLVLQGITVTNSMPHPTGTQVYEGSITALGKGLIELNGTTIDGGTVSVSGSGQLWAIGGVTSTITGAATSNAGVLAAESGDLTIDGNLSSSGTLSALSGYVLEVTGNVSGGNGTIAGSGEIKFDGQATTKVTFESGATGILDLMEPSRFTGTVAGLNTGGFVDLENIPYANVTSVTYSSSKHVVTVVDQTDNITDTIKIAGTAGTFTPSLATDGSTLISDPPASPASVPNNVAQLLVQSIASFGATTGVVPSGAASLAENNKSSEFLAANSHHG